MEHAIVEFTSSDGASTFHIFVSLDGKLFKEVNRQVEETDRGDVEAIISAPTIGYTRDYLNHAGAVFLEL